MVVEDNDVVTAIIALGGDEDDEIGANAEHCLLLAIMMVTMAMTRRVSMMEEGRQSESAARKPNPDRPVMFENRLGLKTHDD